MCMKMLQHTTSPWLVNSSHFSKTEIFFEIRTASYHLHPAYSHIILFMRTKIGNNSTLFENIKRFNF